MTARKDFLTLFYLTESELREEFLRIKKKENPAKILKEFRLNGTSHVILASAISSENGNAKTVLCLKEQSLF